MTSKQITLTAVAALMSVTAAFAQEERSSSSLYLQPQGKSDVTVPFLFSDEGKRYEPTWGLDLQWISEQNINKGINHMGKENIGIGRTGYRFTKALTNDSILDNDQINYLRRRNNVINKVSSTLPLTVTADQEAGTDTYYVTNKSVNTSRWAAMINSHVHWLQANTQHPIVGVSPFNEPDFWTTEEGATVAKQKEVARLLKENYPRFADIAIVGGNTLNNDKAWDWFNTGTEYYDWGNTHQLAGTFQNFASFFLRVTAAGKVGYADEMHNVGEAMIGLEYGMTVGIWWGFDSRARGEFCDISRHGVRLAYAENRSAWTAASVYRHDDGRVKAFIGSSERQATTSTYMLVSPERDVYYDGFGPVREYNTVMPGGTGYQVGQTNAERVIDVTWGEDVAPSYISAGTYKLVNKATGNVAAVSSDNVLQQKYTGTKMQQWNITPATNRAGGDLSFYDFESVNNSKTRMNVLNYSTADMANVMAYSQNNVPSSNEQWYLQYAGDGYYFIRNRESALYLSSASSSANNNVNIVQRTLQTDATLRDRQLWRILPTDVTYETQAPAAPQELSAVAHTASVALSWNANSEEDIDGYMILRAPKDTEEWNTIARKVKTPYYTDNTCTQGTSYIYKVKAIDRAENQSAPSATAEATPTGEHSLIARWHFDEDAYDETPNMMDAVLAGSPTYTTSDYQSGSAALSLKASQNDYVQLPYEVANSDELTFAAWVNMRHSSTWQRIFDFGNGTDQYLFLTTNNGSKMRFAIKNGGAEQTLDCTRPAYLKWFHLAVSIGNGKTSIFINGEEVATTSGITIRPSDIHPVLNYIGRSQFAADPYFTGYIDDVRIYNYALDGDAVKEVMGDTTNGISSTDNTPDDKAPKTIYGIDGRRRQQLQPGINIVDGKKVANRQ